MCCGKREGSRTPSKTSDANLDCVFVKKHTILHQSLIIKSHQKRIELMTRLDAVKVFTWPMTCKSEWVFLPPKSSKCGLEPHRYRGVTVIWCLSGQRPTPGLPLKVLCFKDFSGGLGLARQSHKFTSEKNTNPVAAAQWPCAAQANTAIMSRTQGWPHNSPIYVRTM